MPRPAPRSASTSCCAGFRTLTSQHDAERPMTRMVQRPTHPGSEAMIFDRLFHLMAEKQASDIYVSAGAPIHIKIQGTTIPINQQVMDPGTTQRMAYEMMTPEQIQRFEETREMNLSFGVRGVGNFRVNVLWQRGSVSIVVRFIQGAIPSLESLGLPPVLAEIIMEKRGLVLVVGATGSGKSTTIASMIDYRNINRT